MTQELSLDDLYAEARKAAKAERTAEFARGTRKTKQTEPETPIEPAGLFANPDNWTRTRGLALIHRETKALLGNFWEWKHKTVPDARRLVRSLEPISVERAEEVDFGLSALAPQLNAGKRVVAQRVVTADVALEAPKVSAAGVMLCIHYYDGWTAKAVLVVDTTFAEDGEILQLPAGVDVLPVMRREGKIALRAIS